MASRVGVGTRTIRALQLVLRHAHARVSVITALARRRDLTMKRVVALVVGVLIAALPTASTLFSDPSLIESVRVRPPVNLQTTVPVGFGDRSGAPSGITGARRPGGTSAVQDARVEPVPGFSGTEKSPVYPIPTKPATAGARSSRAKNQPARTTVKPSRGARRASGEKVSPNRGEGKGPMERVSPNRSKGKASVETVSPNRDQGNDPPEAASANRGTGTATETVIADQESSEATAKTANPASGGDDDQGSGGEDDQGSGVGDQGSGGDDQGSGDDDQGSGGKSDAESLESPSKDRAPDGADAP